MRASGLSLCLCVAAGLLGSHGVLAGGERLHVRTGAPSAGANGLSWVTAFPDLQQALDVARAAPASVSEIWVAEGVYLPSVPYTGPGQGNPADPRSRTFLTAGPNVPVYGGFRGDETTLPPIAQRRRRETVLSGDMLGNDNYAAPPGIGNASDNVYHVVRVTNGGCWFNGVTIRGGVANSASNTFDRNGGGLRTTNFEMDVVRLEFCRVTYNFAQADGAGLYNNAIAYIEGCVFDRNRSVTLGGAIRHFGSSLVVVNSVLRQNTAANGGGAYSTTTATFTNCTVVENTGTMGTGGLVAASGATQYIANSLLWANNSPISGGTSLSNSWVQGQTAVDPMLLTTSGPDGAHFTEDDYPFGLIAVYTPLVQQGDDNADIDRSTPSLDPLPATDARGLPRRQLSQGVGSPTVDIGAYEIQARGERMYRLAGVGSWYAGNLWLGGPAIPQFTHGAVFDRTATVDFAKSDVLSEGVEVYGAAVRFELEQTGSYLGYSVDSSATSFTVDRHALLVVAAPDAASGDWASVTATNASIGAESSGRVETEGRVIFGGQRVRVLGQIGGNEPASIEIGPGGVLDTNLLLSIGTRADSWARVLLDDAFGPFGVPGGAIRIGDEGEGELEMINGTQVGTGGADLCVGCEPGSAGRLVVDGSQLTVNAGSSMTLGLHGNAEIEVSSSGVIHSLSVPVQIGSGASPMTSVRLWDGGRIFTLEPVEVGGAGAQGRVVEVELGLDGEIWSPEVRIAPGALLRGAGLVTGNLSNAGRLALESEFVFPSERHLTVTGRFEQHSQPGAASARLEVDVAQENVTDQLIVMGEAALGGALHLNAPFGPPPPGVVFPVVLADSRVGTFDVVSSPVFGDRYFFRVLYRDGSGGSGQAAPVVEVVLDALDVVATFDTEQTVNLQTADGEPLAGATADFNGDGFVDLAVVIPGSTPGNPGCVIVLLNAGVDGLGSWLGFQEFASCVTVGLDPRAIVAFNADGDNDNDVAVANFGSGTVTVLRNDGEGNLASSPPLTLPAPGAPVDIAAADMDLDGNPDLVVASASVDAVLVFHANGIGGFSPAQATPIGAPPTAMTINNLVPGGGPDIAVASALAGAVVVLSNDGSRSLTTAANVPLGGGGVPEDIDSGDVDNDKDIDIIAAATQPEPGNPEAGVVFVIIADSDAPGGFRPPAPLSIGDQPRAVALAQLDNAGGPDIAVIASVDGDPAVQTLINTTLPGGSASFAEPTTLATSGSPRVVLPVDVDNDEDEDLVTLNGGVELALRGVGADISILLNDLDIALPGDVNFDGVVDFQDLNIVLGAFNTTGFGSPADMNDDGFIGFADLNFVLSLFNTR